MMSPLRVVLAPDKFKGSLPADAVATALATGIRRACPTVRTELLPVADGGDGTVDAFVSAGWNRIELRAPGPTGEPVNTSYAMRGVTAVLELAAVVGYARLPGAHPDPLGANTFGLGVLVAHALDAGASRMVLGLGGSASTDGGAGMLTALGVRVLDKHGSELPYGGAALSDAESLDLRDMHPRATEAEFVLACDVDNPLLGPSGAVAVYAPQKGAQPNELTVLEAALANWARIVNSDLATVAGAGAAGGTGFGALAVLDARVRSGIDVVVELLDLPGRLVGAELVLTGEGSLDEQTLRGKAPLGVCAAANTAGVPAVAVAGRVLLSREQVVAAGFDAAFALSDLEPEPDRSVAEARLLLERLGERIADRYFDNAS